MASATRQLPECSLCVSACALFEQFLATARYVVSFTKVLCHFLVDDGITCASSQPSHECHANESSPRWWRPKGSLRAVCYRCEPVQLEDRLGINKVSLAS